MEDPSILRRSSRRLLPVLVCAYSLSSATPIPAQGRVVAQQPVDIVIRSAHSLRLRVGSGGRRIDVVRFDVTGLPGSGPVQGISSGPNPVPVRARAVLLSGQMVLTVDSSAPLDDGYGNTIPFSEIGWVGTGVIPSTTFGGSPNQLVFITSSSRVKGTMSFYYRNTRYVPSGAYTGRVTYTLSSP